MLCHAVYALRFAVYGLLFTEDRKEMRIIIIIIQEKNLNFHGEIIQIILVSFLTPNSYLLTPNS